MLCQRDAVQHHVDRGTGDHLVELNVRGVSLLPRLRASGAVTALACRGRPLPYISYHNSISGAVSSTVIDIWRSVQFVTDINTKG